MEVILREKDAVSGFTEAKELLILFSLTLDHLLLFIGKVMRIRKAPRNDALAMRSPSALTAHERLLWKDVDELISSSDNEIVGQLFVQHVMKPLLGSKYVDAGAIMYVLCFRMRSLMDVSRLKLQLLNMLIEPILKHKLSPLKVCLPTVVEECKGYD